MTRFLTIEEWEKLPYKTPIEVAGGMRGTFRFVSAGGSIHVQLNDPRWGSCYTPCDRRNVWPTDDVVELLASLDEVEQQP